MDGFLDTAILVDVLRGYEPALAWSQANAHRTFAVTAITWMEVMAGAENAQKQRRTGHFLSGFSMEYLTRPDLDWAMMQLAIYHLSHGVGILDCLIAAPAHRLQLPLYTRNLKHFTPLLGNLAQQPY